MVMVMVMVSVIRSHATSMWCKGIVCTTIGVVYMCVVPWCVFFFFLLLLCVRVTPPYIGKEVGNFSNL